MKKNEHYAKNLNKMIEATRSGKIDWSKESECSFFFYSEVSADLLVKVSLEKDKEEDDDDEYVWLQIKSASQPDKLYISLDSERQGVKSLLSELYNEVESKIEEYEIALFDDLVSNFG